MTQELGEKKIAFSPEGLFVSVEDQIKGGKDSIKTYLKDVGFLDIDGKVKSGNLSELQAAKNGYPSMDVLQYIATEATATNAETQGIKTEHSKNAFGFLLEQGMKWDLEKSNGLTTAAKEFGDTELALFNSKNPEQTQTREKEEPAVEENTAPIIAWGPVKDVIDRAFLEKDGRPKTNISS
ncbi:MAG UNVERIFIED_CONTAM: hypothetical protein LVQ98_04815 [Rickettsiaceae bacterium]|jgi:hypothetical protein